MHHQILGIYVSESNGTRFTTLYLSADFPDYRVENALRCEGFETVKVTTVLDCAKLKVGESVTLTYAPSASGKARLVAIQKV